MSDQAGAPVRVRRVSAELRELRVRNGFRAEEVAQTLGFSLSKLSRMENGHRGLHADDVSALLGLYRVSAQRRAELLALVREGADRNWWQVQDIQQPSDWQDLLQFEAQATAIYNWEPLFIPGLLQSYEYAEAIIRCNIVGLPEEDIQRLVDARMDRQNRFAVRGQTSLAILIDEIALRRRVGGADVMRRQLEKLARETRRSQIVFQVVPFDVGEHPGMAGPLVVLEFAKARSLVYLEHHGNTGFLEDREHVDGARAAFRRLRKLALSPEDSVDLINRLADGMT